MLIRVTHCRSTRRVHYPSLVIALHLVCIAHTFPTDIVLPSCQGRWETRRRAKLVRRGHRGKDRFVRLLLPYTVGGRRCRRNSCNSCHRLCTLPRGQAIKACCAWLYYILCVIFFAECPLLPPIVLIQSCGSSCTQGGANNRCRIDVTLLL